MAENTHLCFGPFLLDKANECLRRDDLTITLRPKAYAVLCFLLSNHGTLVTKQQLLDAVWPETFVSDSVLKDSIRQLREALDDPAKSPIYIETAHRRGYRFIAPLTRTASAENQPGQGTGSELQESGGDPGANVLGREANLAQLRSILDKVLRGQSDTVFVTGETGIGKTTLVEAFLSSSSTRILTARGQALEQYGAGEAYLPILDALSRLTRDPTDGPIVTDELRRLAPSWLAQLPRLVSGEELQTLREQTALITRDRMLRELAETIEAVASKIPFVLFLEDLHWSDYSTLDFISYMARRRPSCSFMLIGTYRPVDVILNESPLKNIKHELQLHRLCHELPLEYLTEEFVAEFLNTKFPNNSFPTRLAKLIHRQTEGNPLFMVNVVDYLVDLHQIVDVDGQFKLAVPIDEVELQVPENIRHVIEKHIERLTLEEQGILEGASVVGMDCSAVAIGAGLDIDVMEVEEICESLARRRHFLLPAYIAELPDGTITPRYRFIHALYLDVLYRRVALTRRSQIHGRIGERGESIYGEGVGEIAAELAVHFEQARDLQRAVKYLQIASENAQRRSANYESVELAERGLQILSIMPQSAETTVHEESFRRRISALKDSTEN